MFTPPPSPEPSRVLLHEPEFSSASEAEEESSSGTFLTADRRSIRPSSSSVPLASYSEQPSKVEQFSRAEAKQRTARRTKWTILLVPAVLIFITVSTRHLSHPAALDTLSSDHHDASWHEWSSSLKDWSLHKRHPSPDPDPQQDQSSAPIISFASPTASTSVITSATPSSTDRVLPTIPSSPPVLPTPFPRPLTAVNQNFTTLGCQNFFNNMTSSEAFLDCRPFSLLVKSSAEFIDQAQNNLTALNTIIWGTCNTDTSTDQCTANMGWFADTLKSQCSQDLINMNTLVVETLTELQAYSLMRTAACLPDPSTNTYCYVEAAHNTNPADLYFYQLPFGIKVPTTSKPSCSSCTKSVMALYAQSLNVSALAKTYDSAAAVANGACGTGYVQTTTIGAAKGRDVPMGMLYATVLGLVSYGAMW